MKDSIRKCSGGWIVNIYFGIHCRSTICRAWDFQGAMEHYLEEWGNPDSGGRPR